MQPPECQHYAGSTQHTRKMVMMKELAKPIIGKAGSANTAFIIFIFIIQGVCIRIHPIITPADNMGNVVYRLYLRALTGLRMHSHTCAFFLCVVCVQCQLLDSEKVLTEAAAAALAS